MSKYFLVKEDGTRLDATEEQELIVDKVLTQKNNLIINALAGAAKTSTLEFICKYHPVIPILSLAFNKRIAVEMEKRLPGNVKCATLNAIGHRAWSATCVKKLTLDDKKSYNILKELVDELRPSKREEAYDTFGDTLKLIKEETIRGYIPNGLHPHARRLCSSDKFWGTTEEECEPNQVALVDEAVTISIKQSYNGLIDFDDQIYMPTLFGGTFPQFPLVLVDEAQDLSPINHAMLEKIVTQRIIAVGDPWQSIYGFRGAVANGMESLKRRFEREKLTISVSFRCPIQVVKNAHNRVPHMRWPAWAKEGEVSVLPIWSAQKIPDYSAIICRNNAPLFSCALDLLRYGRGIHLVGSDLGPALVKALRKMGEDSMDRMEVHTAISRGEAEKLKKSRSPGAVKDKADCLRVFADFGDNLGQAIRYAETLFATKGPIQLLSGHKSKGLEWETVYHLDPWRIPSPFAEEGGESYEQELNVRYVIETRAKHSLFLVNLTELME